MGRTFRKDNPHNKYCKRDNNARNKFSKKFGSGNYKNKKKVDLPEEFVEDNDYE